MEEMLEAMERIRRRLLRELSRALAETVIEADVAPDGSLRPLYTVYEYPDRYVVLVDLPAADTSSLSVTATRDSLVIEASLEREVSFSDVYGTMVGREVRLSRYRTVIPLPEDAEPEGIRVDVKPSKIVEITIPRRARAR